MSELSFPWLTWLIVMPLVGAALVSRLRDSNVARKWSLAFFCATFICALLTAVDYSRQLNDIAHDPWDWCQQFAGTPVLTIDDLSAPLLPLAAMLPLLISIATLRTKVRRFSFTWTLVSEAILLATLSCRLPWGIIALLAAGTVPPFLELRARHQATRVYVIHMALFVALMVVGWSFVESEGENRLHSLWAVVPLLGAILIRSGIAPFHCWMPDLFERASFGRALLFVTPMMGAYAAVRLVLPIAPDWVMRSIGFVALATAVYAAGMALVQTEARRFFCYVLLSHSALVLVGLVTISPIGLTGALCVWMSIGLSLAGFGLTMRALEARHGRLSLTRYHGAYEHTPALAICFLLTGMASVGFPGTFGFLGTELLVDGVVTTYPLVGMAVVIAAALNGIAVVKAYFLLFTGTRLTSSISLAIGRRERFAVLILAALILGGGLFPQPWVASRFHAAEQILREREQSALNTFPRDAENIARLPELKHTATD
jgi:NADH-quinone oxidoreductase subunit M